MRNSHLLIKLNFKGEIMRSSHILIKVIEIWSPKTRNYYLPIMSMENGKPSKQELIIFSSCLSKMTDPLTRNSPPLTKSNLKGRDDENFSYNLQVC